MSAVVLDHLLPQNSPISPPSRPFTRSAPNGFLNKSQENAQDPASPVGAALPQGISRPTSRRSSKIFTNNLATRDREDSLGSSLHYFGINPSVWADSPVVYDSPTTSNPSTRSTVSSAITGNSAPVPSPVSAVAAPPKESTGFSYGVSSIGRGFDWKWSAEPESTEQDVDDDDDDDEQDIVQPLPPISRQSSLALGNRSLSLDIVPSFSSMSNKNSQKLTLSLSDGILVPHNQPMMPQPHTTPAVSVPIPPSPRYRRRSSQKHFSLVAGRLHFTPPPSPPPDSSSEIPVIPGLTAPTPKLLRLASTSSFMSVSSVLVGPPTPGRVQYAGDRSISEFVLQGDVGRGAYGLVKRGREVMADGSYGVRLSS
jgi:protein-serine/threonine kinase